MVLTHAFKIQWNKSWLIGQWMIWIALLSMNVLRHITCHSSIYWQHPAAILKLQDAEVDLEELFTG
jgi:hypothetical protein